MELAFLGLYFVYRELASRTGKASKELPYRECTEVYGRIRRRSLIYLQLRRPYAFPFHPRNHSIAPGLESRR
jgi:hypothetical protein